MKTKRNILFTSLIIIIYIATVLIYSASLIAEYRTGPERSDFRISELVRETRQNAQANLPGSDPFNRTLLLSMGDLRDLAGLQVLKDGSLIFSYPRDLGGSNAGRSSLVRVKSEKIKAKDGSELTMTAAVYLITPDSIFKKGIIAFAVILLTTIAAIIHLVMLYRSESGKGAVQEKDSEKDKNDFFDDDILEEDSQRIENTLNRTQVMDEPTVEIQDAPIEEKIDDDAYLPDITESSDSEPKPEMDDETFDEEAAEKAISESVKDFDSKSEADSVPAQDEITQAQTVFEEPPLDENSPENADETDVQNATVMEKADESETDAENEENDAEAFDVPVLGTNLTQEEYQALTKGLITDSNDEEPVPEMQVTLPAENTPAKIFTDGLSSRKEEKSLPQTNYLKPLPALPEKKDENVATKPLAGKRPMPEGLFSPETGFGWEEYMMPRLDSELMKSAASDQDLSLFMLNIPKFDWTSEAGEEIIKIIEDCFQFKDLIFEYGESGCSAIMQNINIVNALKTAENLHTQIIATLAKRSIYRVVNIGISSRSLRLISGKRLANEAEQALLHAMNEKNTPIVAFKVNPEKYRKYISREVAKLEGKD